RVTYWYREHPTDRKVEVSVSVYEFIRRMIQHIMPKSFKVIRHYGLYPFRKVTRIRELLTKLFEKGKGIAQEFELLLKKTAPARSYRERMIRSFGKDPLICEDCGQEMMLYSIWHPGYGIIYSFEDDCVPLIEERDYEEKEEKKGEASEQLCFPF
ncbi:MAG: transposase, partial [bacterium]